MAGEVQRWADPAMYAAEPIEPAAGPRVYLLEMTSDPLGSIAALSAMYTGRVIRSKEAVTDEERLHHLQEMQRTKLTTPLEAVKFHFLIEGVTRAFTHQLVRNRTSAYAQESMRFAVKEDMPVALPPSLAGTKSEDEYGWHLADLHDADWCVGDHLSDSELDRMPVQQRQRIIWDRQVASIRVAYNALVNSGIPAEDARGLVPTNVLTRINWVTDLRTLIDVLGVRLCTQAQFEWRTVANQIAAAIAEGYKLDRRWVSTGVFNDSTESYGGAARRAAKKMANIELEYRAIAGLFRPICYLTGKCEFMSDADRACSIRERVQANHAIGRPSRDWDKPCLADPYNPKIFGSPEIGAIHPEEWMLDPGAAR